MPTKVCTDYLESFIAPHELINIEPLVKTAFDMVKNGTGAGNDYLGWVDLPTNYDKAEFERILEASKKIRAQSKVLVVIGIGGSYLGSRAVIDLLKSPFYNESTEGTKIYYAGNQMSSDYLAHILSVCETEDFSVNIISKSGTTTEPAMAFRLLRALLEKKYGADGAKSRIYCTTDAARGTLKQLADGQGYETFVIPDDVGGRFSVLTAVGLLPIAVSGVDILALMQGADAARVALSSFSMENDAVKYAALRNILYGKGKTTELFVSYHPYFGMMNEWLKQLFGESEGKDQKGIFPASALFSTDLHSMGQYIQDGRRILFETVMHLGKEEAIINIEPDKNDFDGLNFLAGKTVFEVNENAFQGTVLAHTDGGVPNIILNLPAINPFEVGYLLYFFQISCAISGYLLGVNPFNQPGVEDYKTNMFALLEKPGFEVQRKALLKRLPKSN